MLTIACVYSGGSYKPEHVERLRKQLIGKINQPYNFVCLDDSPWPGYWAKISLFEPGRFKGRVLYIDLDVDIVNNLDEIANFPWPFCAGKEWTYPGMHSALMAWDAGAGDHIFNQFSQDVIDSGKYLGDQNYIDSRMLGIAKFPEEWCVSYKKHVKPTGKVPEGAKVVCYHGTPKPWDI